MTTDEIKCRLLHRRWWMFVMAKMTGPSIFAMQRHVGVYECAECGRRHRLVADKWRPGDERRAYDSPPPARGRNMALHRLLGGPIDDDGKAGEHTG